MYKIGSSSHIESKTAHKQFFQWAVKWFYANLPENTSSKPDIPSLICLLQTIGFKLREFEKCDRLIHHKDSAKNNTIKITLECGTSKMIAVLEMDDIKCECPDNNETKGGSLWSITGTEPIGSMDNINKIEETGSNLLPKMSKETSSVVRDVVHRLFKIINNKCDINQNIDLDKNLSALRRDSITMKNTKNLIRSYTDLNDLNRNTSKLNMSLSHSKFNSSINVKESTALTSPKLMRQGTYDIDDENENMDEPRPSPPKIASSPVLHELCTSLGEISLQSEEEILSLADYVIKAYQILEKAINSIIKKLPINSNNSSFQESNNFVRPTPPPLMSSSFCISSPRNHGSNNIINRSMSNTGSSRPNSACSLQSRTSQSIKGIPVVQKSIIQRTGATRAPAMRDRSSSCSIPQRPQHISSKVSSHSGHGPTRRNSTTGIISSGIAQRMASVGSKVPTSKLAQNKVGNNWISERPITTLKRHISPEAKSQNYSPARQQRINVSFMKAPPSNSKLSTGITSNNSSKFGYYATKK